MPYHLHSVSIHNGTGSSGHYYTYVKDHSLNVWRQFNDFNVRTVDEDQVLAEAAGDGLSKTAYWVVYISEKELKGQKLVDMYAFEPEVSAFYRRHPYSAMAEPLIVN